ncbi:MAG: acyltransferase [Pirellulales bacterium]
MNRGTEGDDATHGPRSESSGSAEPHRVKEIVSLTSLRGFLAVAIVLHHFWNDIVLLFPRLHAVRYPISMAHMAVPGFFMLSGFVLAYNYAREFRRLAHGKVLRFWKFRLARIYPVHLATLLFLAALVWGVPGVRSDSQDDLHSGFYFVLNLFLVQSWTPAERFTWNFPAWSISTEWFAYLLFPFVARGILLHLSTPLRAATSALAALACSIAYVFYWHPLPFFNLLLVVPTFFAGAAVYCYYAAKSRSSTDSGAVDKAGFLSTAPRPARDFGFLRILPEVLVVAAIAGCFVLSVEGMIAGIFASILGIIAALAFLGDACLPVWRIAPSVFLGEVSYSLYMTHTIVHRFLRRLLLADEFETAGVATKLGLLGVYAVVVGLACLATYYSVERPARRWVRARTAKKPSVVGSGS